MKIMDFDLVSYFYEQNSYSDNIKNNLIFFNMFDKFDQKF